MSGRHVPRFPLRVSLLCLLPAFLLTACADHHHRHELLRPPVRAPLDGWVVYSAVDSLTPRGQWTIFKIRLDGSERTRLPTPGRGPRWSPDGRYIACINEVRGMACQTSCAQVVFMTNAAGTRVRSVGWTYQSFVEWNPRGDRVLVAEGVADTSGGSFEYFEPPRAQFFEGDSIYRLQLRQWAADGRRVYVTGYVGPLPDSGARYDWRRSEVFEAEFPSGKLVRRLTHNRYSESYEADRFEVSPDGSHLLMESGTGGDRVLATLGPTDSIPVPFEPPIPGYAPRWAADGRTIVYMGDPRSAVGSIRIHSIEDARGDWQVAAPNGSSGDDYGPDIFLSPPAAFPGRGWPR